MDMDRSNVWLSDQKWGNKWNHKWPKSLGNLILETEIGINHKYSKKNELNTMDTRLSWIKLMEIEYSNLNKIDWIKVNWN